MIRFFHFIFVLSSAQTALAFSDGICNLGEDWCGRKQTRSVSANPSKSSKININPSAVPTEKGFGVEVIGYKDSADLGLVRGLGRVGAAISPSNSEETFFGAPGFEFNDTYLDRKIEKDKYQQQKYTLATAFNLYDRKKSGLKQVSLNLGVLAKYNQLTGATTPGGGVSGVLGPFTFGYSVYRDETLIQTTLFDNTLYSEKIQSIIESYSIGFYLDSLIIDYSSLRMQNEEDLYVELVTASLLINRFIISASQRTEKSSRPSFNFRTNVLQSERDKVEHFYGLQMRITPYLMVGALYNYYLLREYAVSGTLFF